MFTGCEKLVGDRGTTYVTSHTDHKYARLDGGKSNLGYFTYMDPTGINTVANDEAVKVGEWYTLDGRKLSGKPSAKGIYIIGGKKVLVK